MIEASANRIFTAEHKAKGEVPEVCSVHVYLVI
jgi:hypothetical protein